MNTTAKVGIAILATAVTIFVLAAITGLLSFLVPWMLIAGGIVLVVGLAMEALAPDEPTLLITHGDEEELDERKAA
jgi:hypothetical protein